MNIDEINRKHYIQQDIMYRVSYGMASKLIKFEKGVIHIELEIRSKCNKSYNEAALEMAHCWKNFHHELKQAFACKVFIIDSKKYSYKRTLLHLGIKPGYDAKKGVIFKHKPSN